MQVKQVINFRDRQGKLLWFTNAMNTMCSIPSKGDFVKHGGKVREVAQVAYEYKPDGVEIDIYLREPSQL